MFGVFYKINDTKDWLIIKMNRSAAFHFTTTLFISIAVHSYVFSASEMQEQDREMSTCKH